MLVVYLLWITVVSGGLFMGLGAVRHLLADGFDLALMLNATLYLGCAIYGTPKLVRLLLKRG